jgi:hypothetical protein
MTSRARLPGNHAGERAALVPEELTEEQRPVQRAGVDGLEAAFPPRAELPDGPGDEFLARGDRWNPMVLAQF